MSKITQNKPYNESDIENHSGKVGGRKNLREISVVVDDEEYCYLVKKPGRKEVQAITAATEKKDLNQVQKLTLGCVLEGDREAYENDAAIYLQLMQQIGSLVKAANSSIKKL